MPDYSKVAALFYIPISNDQNSSLFLHILNISCYDFLIIATFPCGSAGKESACNMGDLGSIPGLGRSRAEEKGYQLQYSDLENSMDCIVYGVTKSQTRLSDFHFHFQRVWSGLSLWFWYAFPWWHSVSFLVLIIHLSVFLGMSIHNMSNLKCLLRFFVYFLNWVLCLCYWAMCVLYLCWIKSPVRYDLCIFSLVLWVLFTFLMVSFEVQRFFTSMKSKLLFLLTLVPLVLYLKRLLPNQRAQWFTPIFF